MKATLLAGAITAAIGSTASANGLYWVVGDRVTNTCDIVTRNPTVFMYGGGDIWFGDGPYKSVDDAKLARATIRACPKVEPREQCDDGCK